MQISIKKPRFINESILEQWVQVFIPLEKQVQFKPQQLEQLIDSIEEELILKKAKEINDRRKIKE